MKRYRFSSWIILACWLTAAACIDDKTTGFLTEGSPIVITAADTVFYEDFGIPLVISPEISQSVAGLPLTYEWKMIAESGDGSDSLRLIGTEKVLNYKFPRSGVFRLRLRVENQYGSSFMYFTANIRAPFEQGLLILSNDMEDRGRISFLRLKDEQEVVDKTEADFNLDAFAQANPEQTLRGARDLIVTRTGPNSRISHYALAISSEPDQKIYFMNPQYFLMENISDLTLFFPEAYPTVLCGNDATRSDEILVATHDRTGKPGDFGIIRLESQLAYPAQTSGIYDKIIMSECYLPDFRVTDYVGCLIDNTSSQVYGVYNSAQLMPAGDRFSEQRIVNALFYGMEARLLMISADKSDPRRISIHKGTKARNWENNEISFESDPYSYTASEDITLTFDNPMVGSEKYQYAYYSSGNKLYRWIFMASEPKLPVVPDLTLEQEDEITCLGISPDQEHLWVCVYNPNAPTQLKGKLLIYNADNLTLEKTFKGISDRAVKVMWKPAK